MMKRQLNLKRFNRMIHDVGGIPIEMFGVCGTIRGIQRIIEWKAFDNQRKRKNMNEAMKSLLVEKQGIEDLESLIAEKKKKIAKLAVEIESSVGSDQLGNIYFEGGYYQMRKRKGGGVYLCGPRDSPFGSWRKTKK